VRILVVEDDLPLAEGLKHGLRRGGHVADVVHNGDQAKTMLAASQWDLVLLDLGLPGSDGLTVMRSLRARRAQPLVIILTARDGPGDRVRGLDAGADDYLVKPFEMDELLARIRAVTRRAEGSVTSAIVMGSLSLDVAGRRFALRGKPLDLPPREFGVLEILLKRRGRVVSKAQIQDQLCDWSEDLSDTAIEICVHRLRKRLEGADVQLRTLRGFGYLIDARADDHG
jgi:DNA-binding response OmpR family regulator